MTTTHQHSRYLTLGDVLAAEYAFTNYNDAGINQFFETDTGFAELDGGITDHDPIIDVCHYVPIDCTLGAAIWQRTDNLCHVDLSSRWELSAGHPNDCGPFIGTLLVGIGADGGNVLIPAIIKDNFPTKIPVATSQYTLSMLLVGSLGTGLSGVLAAHWSLPLTMAVLSVIGLINLVVWLPNLKYNHRAPTVTMTASDGQSTATHGSVWRRPLAWVVTAFFGLQALVYYSLLTWLPTVFVAHGFSLIVAGNLVTVMQLSGLPMSYLVPATSGHRRGVWAMIMVVGVGFIAGLVVSYFPERVLGGSTVLRLARIRIWSSLQFGSRLLYAKTTNGFETADLSGMAQSAGCLLAAVGPVLFGWLGGQLGWGTSTLVAIILSALLALSGSVIFQHATIYE